MSIRNFWLRANVDGRRRPVTAGPRAKDGGFTLDIFYRDRGRICDHVLRVTGRCVNHRLVLDIEDAKTSVFTKEVTR